MNVLNGSEAMIGRTGGTTGTSCRIHNYDYNQDYGGGNDDDDIV